MSNRILLVEDDATLSMIISETLRLDGFDVTVASDGEQGLAGFIRVRPDLVIADVMMPKLDGFSMIRKLRQIDRNVPVLFLTAKSEIEDIVEGFGAGADDYLKKPFRMMELIVRIKALLRRGVPSEDPLITIGQYTLDTSALTLCCQGHDTVELTLIESRLLHELAMNIGNTVESATLMMLIWQRDDPYSRNSLHGFIHKLRHYLRHDRSLAILNQRGIGYRLVSRT
ncbi:MAG: response regulator transcription factor [Muribaculaceae bacterium]|nr:response regulator transcription factor [Muribaculaceae bacterium]